MYTVDAQSDHPPFIHPTPTHHSSTHASGPFRQTAESTHQRRHHPTADQPRGVTHRNTGAMSAAISSPALGHGHSHSPTTIRTSTLPRHTTQP